MDKFGRQGRSLTLKPRHLGTNVGTSLNEPVDPAAQFVAGMVAFKDPITGLIRAAIGGGSNDEDLPGQAYGILGLTKFDRTALRVINEPAIAPATTPDTINLQKNNLFDGVTPATWGVPSIYNVTAGEAVTAAEVTSDVIGHANTDLSKGILAGITGAAMVSTALVAAGDELLISYYYRPLQDDRSPIGLDETAPQGAVTVWKNQGQFEVLVYEAVDTAGNPGLPAVNDPLYVSPNGLLTADSPAATSWMIAICRRAPSFGDPFMYIDLLI